jgi:hypothetical protein
MRPIDRGEHPKNADGSLVDFPEYSYARPYLIAKLGEYCSYCEMHLDSALAVEHILPKDSNPLLEKSWNNFLLGCPNCNSTKSHKNININDYYWPHLHNTFYIFQYCLGGIIIASPKLNDDEKIIAERTLKLTGLDKTPLDVENHTSSDRRWDNNRREAWDMAQRAKVRLQCNNTHPMREQVVDTVLANGYWSVWLTVFEDDPDMLQRLLDASPGICRRCFDKPELQIPGCLHSGGQ